MAFCRSPLHGGTAFRYTVSMSSPKYRLPRPGRLAPGAAALVLAAVTGLTCLAGFANLALAQAQQDRAALVDSLYEKDIKRVQATPDKADDLALAPVDVTSPSRSKAAGTPLPPK